MNTIPLRFIELAKVVEQECLGTYPYEAVAQYLNHQVDLLKKQGQYGAVWDWRPIKEYPYSKHARWFSPPVYSKPIPYPVLVTVQKIGARIREAEFCVSDIQHFPDPISCGHHLRFGFGAGGGTVGRAVFPIDFGMGIQAFDL